MTRALGVVMAVAGVVAERCRRGMSWRFDGVLFTVLSPAGGGADVGNDASCVVLVETAKTRVLLPGDIEKTVENRLAPPSVDLLVVPHHGSATSSTDAFVAAAKPAFAVISAGWDSHFGHPHPKVVERYRHIGAHIVSTAAAGAISWRSDRPEAIASARCRSQPYWRRQPAAWRRTPRLSPRLLPCPR